MVLRRPSEPAAVTGKVARLFLRLPPPGANPAFTLARVGVRSNRMQIHFLMTTLGTSYAVGDLLPRSIASAFRTNLRFFVHFKISRSIPRDIWSLERAT